MLRLLALGFAAVACAAFALVLGLSACLTAPPPDLPQPTIHRPTIEHDALDPSTDQILVTLPNEFVVPVELDDLAESFEWDAFVDFNACADPAACTPSAPYQYPTVYVPTSSSIDAGVVTITVPPPGGLDPEYCHTIQILVAHSFVPGLPHTWDNVGGDIATWFYNPAGRYAACPEFDAGKFEDGAFPPEDAASDGIPLVPESGT